MAATTIDQYVTTRDSQVIFFPSPFFLGRGEPVWLIDSDCYHDTKAADWTWNRTKSRVFSLLKVSKKEKRLLPLFDDVQDPWEEGGHVSIQSRKAWPSATFCHKFKIFIFISLFYLKKKMKRKWYLFRQRRHLLRQRRHPGPPPKARHCRPVHTPNQRRGKERNF